MNWFIEQKKLLNLRRVFRYVHIPFWKWKNLILKCVANYVTNFCHLPLNCLIMSSFIKESQMLWDNFVISATLVQTRHMYKKLINTLMCKTHMKFSWQIFKGKDGVDHQHGPQIQTQWHLNIRLVLTVFLPKEG